jgi:ABC-type hemin transport system ATPase subunit
MIVPLDFEGEVSERHECRAGALAPILTSNGPANHLSRCARTVGADAGASVVILDEPTASLSALEAERLFSVIDRFRRRGVGVLCISDRIVILRNGRGA